MSDDDVTACDGIDRPEGRKHRHCLGCYNADQLRARLATLTADMAEQRDRADSLSRETGILRRDLERVTRERDEAKADAEGWMKVYGKQVQTSAGYALELHAERVKLATAWTPCSNCGAGVQVPAHAVAPDSLLVPMCGPCGRSWRADLSEAERLLEEQAEIAKFRGFSEEHRRRISANVAARDAWLSRRKARSREETADVLACSRCGEMLDEAHPFCSTCADRGQAQAPSERRKARTP